MNRLDSTDARILLAMDKGARSPVIDLAGRLGLARRTVQHRIARFEEAGMLRRHSDRVPVEALGYRVTAMISAEVRQSHLEAAVEALAGIPEVLEAAATTGGWDLTCRVAARDNDDLYRVGQEILGCPGILRTSTSVLMRDLIRYRTTGLLSRHATTAQRGGTATTTDSARR